MDGIPNSASFNIEIVNDGHAIVTREIIFQNQNSIAFSVGLDTTGMTVGEIQSKSVATVIDQLNSWLTPN